VACIDEFEKMNDRDRVALHEVMEQGTVSIAKAGIVATLNARTSILASANPVYGRYIRHKSLIDNIDLPITLLSRFDLIFIMIDEPQERIDAEIAEHILDLHSKNYEKRMKDIIPPDLLKKYILYARKYVCPKLSEKAKEKIKEFYIKLRKISENPNNPVIITTRQLEALIRLSEAEARMRLSDVVTEEDVERAINLMVHYMRNAGIDAETGMIDIDIIMTGKPLSQREKIAKLLQLIKELEEESKDGTVSKKVLLERAKEAGLDEEWVKSALERMHSNGELYEPRPGYIKLI